MRTWNVRRVSRLLVCVALAGCAAACTVRYRRDVEAPGTKASYQKGMAGWLRYDGYEDVAGDLQVALADCRKPGSPVTIRLVGAIHLGDGAYYKKLQQTLNGCDLVLYEGVRLPDQPAGSVDPSTRMVWSAVAGLMGLKAQVEAIDYARPRWRQVDMLTDQAGAARPSGALPPEAADRMKEALGTLARAKRELGLFVDLREMQDAFKHQYAVALGSSDADPEEGLRRLADQVGRLRKAVADLPQDGDGGFFERIEEALARVEENFRRLSTLLITKRNAYVVEALEKELVSMEDSKGPKTIGVFYGAGHMSDFIKRLEKLGYKTGRLKYVTAWAMNSRR